MNILIFKGDEEALAWLHRRITRSWMDEGQLYVIMYGIDEPELFMRMMLGSCGLQNRVSFKIYNLRK